MPQKDGQVDEDVAGCSGYSGFRIGERWVRADEWDAVRSGTGADKGSGGEGSRRNEAGAAAVAVA